MTTKIVKHKRSLCGRIRRVSLQMIAACGILAGTAGLQSCEKDILEGQPEKLGNSIYERLQEGINVNDGSHKTFNYTLRLIDDLGESEILAHTGSKTLFASSDDAFEAWFAKQGKTYDQLTLTEKKSLLYNAMIDNAYLTELMSNVAGTPPLAGAAMRRESSATYLDSIIEMKREDMPSKLTSTFDEENSKSENPVIDAWSYDRTKNSIHIVRDNTNPPMIHFLPKFMQNIGMTDEDLKIISNGQSNSIEDAWVNGMKVISTEQTCKNGYIYVIDGVMDYKSNMAQVLSERSDTKLWAQALNRFAVPLPISDPKILSDYHNATGNTDTLFVMSYLNSSENHALLTGGHMKTTVNEGSGALLFDPGWNQYRPFNRTDNNTMYKDAAVMIVPTDDVVRQWMQGEGKDFTAEFGSWENIPYENLTKIFKVNMLTSFTASLPSKFDYILDQTTQNKLGIKPENVKECIMCNNGVIYLVNKFFTPEEYSSIIYPTELKKSGIYSAINHSLSGSYGGASGYLSSYDFSPYLSALGTKFSFFAPYNVTPSTNETQQKAGDMFRMIDPCSYGIGADKDSLNIMEVYYGKPADATSNLFGVNATYFGGKEQGEGSSWDINENVAVSAALIKSMKTMNVANRMYNLIDNSVIIGEVDAAAPGQEYFLTKGGSIVRVKKEGGNVKIQGGYQMEHDYWITVPNQHIVHKTNGATYGICSAEALASAQKLINVPQTAQNSVWKIMEQEAAKSGATCTLFYEYLNASGLLLDQSSGYNSGQGQKNLSLFDSFNYTVYAPVDAAIREMIDNEWLPKIDDINAEQAIIDDPDASAIDVETAKKNVESMKKIIKDFISYHIQDNAVMVNGPVVNSIYETGLVNNKTNRFYTLDVVQSNGTLTVRDQAGDTRHVAGFHNKVACEYWIKGTPGDISADIATSSSAAVHQIDGVLYYDKASQQRKWKTQVSSAKRSRFIR